MIRVALDTSLMVGLLDPKDIWHSKSLALKNLLIENDARIVIFDCVIAEVISILTRRFHEKRRQGDFDVVLSTLLDSYPLTAITWILPGLPQKYLAVLDLVRTTNKKARLQI